MMSILPIGEFGFAFQDAASDRLAQDSLNFTDYWKVSWYALFVGEYESAIEAAQKSLEDVPGVESVDSFLALGYLLSDRNGPKPKPSTASGKACPSRPFPTPQPRISSSKTSLPSKPPASPTPISKRSANY